MLLDLRNVSPAIRGMLLTAVGNAHEAIAAILAALRTTRTGEPVDVPMEKLGVVELSLGRAVRAIVTGDWRGAEAERRTMGLAPGALGGFMVPSVLSASVIDLARAQARETPTSRHAALTPIAAARRMTGRRMPRITDGARFPRITSPSQWRGSARSSRSAGQCSSPQRLLWDLEVQHSRSHVFDRSSSLMRLAIDQ